MAASLILGSGEVFAPVLLGRLALIDAAWLGGLVVVHAALAVWSRPWHGRHDRRARRQTVRGTHDGHTRGLGGLNAAGDVNGLIGTRPGRVLE